MGLLEKKFMFHRPCHSGPVILEVVSWKLFTT